MYGDTIAAISTPIGEGGIGIVRLSGPEAVQIADRVFRSREGIPLLEVPTHTIHYGHIVAHGGGDTIDEVLVSVMRAPRTYTREDVVEINCHGGIVATRAVLDAVLTQGSRLAERGEFTKRAFLSGRISLDQAKAVLDVVSAKTRIGLEVAVAQLNGRFSDAIAALREDISFLLAEIEVGIDYPDEDAHQQYAVPAVDDLRVQVNRLIAESENGRVLTEGLTIAIIGRPNVGKSTLLNAFLSENRAIVTEIPGTTRDTVEETAAIGGVPVRLIDTAGLREPGDPVEAEGVKRSQNAILRADLLLLLLDRSEPLTEEDLALLSRSWDRPVFVVLNKSDLQRVIEPFVADYPMYEISAETREGVDGLTCAIVDRLLGGQLPSHNSMLLLDTWERDLLRRMKKALAQAAAAIAAGLSLDMIAEELRTAHAIAGELQGIDVGEEVLDQLFRRFCVGK